MTQRATPAASRFAELGRYILNGLAATAVHYGVLSFNMHMLHMPSAGVANFAAAWFGIAASFIGSRHFVFRQASTPWGRQALRFLGLYASIACLHGLLLFAWTDLLHLHYSIGFLIATALQTLLSYAGNKLLVFTGP